MIVTVLMPTGEVTTFANAYPPPLPQTNPPQEADQDQPGDN